MNLNMIKSEIQNSVENKLKELNFNNINSEFANKIVVHQKRLNETIEKAERAIDKNTKLSENKTTTAEQKSKKNYQYQIKISGFTEAHGTKNKLERYNINKDKINNLLSQMEINDANIEDIFPVGKYSSDKNRTLIVTFSSVWDKRRILSNRHFLKNFTQKIFVSPVLSPTDQIIENSILKKRRELIEAGTSRSTIKIKDLKLFVNNEEIQTE